jgi:hypothetical protein
LLDWSHACREKHDQYNERVPQPAGAKANDEDEKEAGDRTADALRQPKKKAE